MIANSTYRALAERFAAALRDRLGDQLVSVVLYGSVARGEARPESDIDLFVVVESAPRSRWERDAMLEPVERALSAEIRRSWDQGLWAHFAWTLKTREEAARTRPLYLDMTEDAVLLFDRDGFFGGVLDRLRAKLREMGARRLQASEGYCYWDLKPDWKPGDVVQL